MTRLAGIAAPYANPCQRTRDDGESYWEWFRPGCFNYTISRGWEVFASYQHKDVLKFASTKDGSLRLFDKPDGMHFEMTPGDDYFSRFVVELVRQGKVTGMSVCYRVKSDDWYTRNGALFRQVNEADLIEISVVPRGSEPRFRNTSVYVMSETPTAISTRQLNITEERRRLAA